MTYEIKIPNVPIKIRRNNDWEKTLAFKQPNGSLVDLDGASFKLQIKAKASVDSPALYTYRCYLLKLVLWCRTKSLLATFHPLVASNTLQIGASF